MKTAFFDWTVAEVGAGLPSAKSEIPNPQSPIPGCLPGSHFGVLRKPRVSGWRGVVWGLSMAVTVVLTGPACWGGDFVNLGFNDPVLTSLRQNPVHGYWEALATEALFGWTIEAAQGPLPNQGFISVDGGYEPMGLEELSPGSDFFARFGKYRLAVSTYWDSLHLPRGWIRLSQTGTVPADSAYLRYFEFRGGIVSDPPPIEVYINGALQPPYPGGFGIFDVSQFAGQEVTLSFLFPGGGTGYAFDITGFAPVPEPSVWVLLALGALTLLVVRRKRES